MLVNNARISTSPILTGDTNEANRNIGEMKWDMGKLQFKILILSDFHRFNLKKYHQADLSTKPLQIIKKAKVIPLTSHGDLLDMWMQDSTYPEPIT